MKTPKVSVHIRFTRPDGSRHYLKPVFVNRRLKPLYALVDKKPEHFPSGVYYMRYTQEGKPRWEMIGANAEQVLDILRERKHDLEGAALGRPAAALTPKPVVVGTLHPTLTPVLSSPGRQANNPWMKPLGST